VTSNDVGVAGPRSWPLVALVGPTASGKSRLALHLAETHAVEIVSCDSLQVYRGLDIGSAKPTQAEQARVRHHLLDVAEPHDIFSAAGYASLARAALADVRARGRLPVVVGGTGLYLRALLSGLFEGPARDEQFRRRLERLATRRGDARLHALLAAIDPKAAARIHTRDRLRVVRALEVYRATRRTLSQHFEAPTSALEGFQVLTLGLEPTRAELRERVAARTKAMFAAGLVAETAAVLAHYGGTAPRPLNAIGYRQALAVLRGDLQAAEAEAQVVQKTMQYAKRQLTWFRHQAQVEWHPNSASAFAAALAFWDAARGPEDPQVLDMSRPIRENQGL
jgi:tRNA dimethylallyltransferase